jgi:hypothetical protein
MKFYNKHLNNDGFMLAGLLVFSSISVLIVSVIITAAISNIKLSRKLYDREKTFHLAEAGIEYYRWHLAHANLDFKDGTNTDGPYVRSVKDVSGNDFGTFSLDITAPAIGSTIVNIKSEGNIPLSGTSRKIETIMAIPSLARYAVVANDYMRFGQGTQVFGPLHSNNGIRFDGIAHNIVTSAVTSYDDPDHTDSNIEFGVHTHVNVPPGIGTTETYRSLEGPPNAVLSRNDVFVAGRQFPVPAADFTGLTSNLVLLKTQATTSGKYFAPSGTGNKGYYILLKIDNTFDLYTVNSVDTSCAESWSIDSKTYIANYAIPANGIIFVEDDVWVDGQINNSRATITAGAFPDVVANYKSITINNDLLYTNYDGSDVIALIAQKNINVGLRSEDDLKIDAALVAQNGRVGRFGYASSCGAEYRRNSITLYGMIATKGRYGFTYTSSGVYSNGYLTRNINYDSNLLYGPPPSFPLTSSQYTTISWKEIAP